MENIAKWTKDQTNSNRMVSNIKTASLFEGQFCILSRQIYWGNYQKNIIVT